MDFMPIDSGFVLKIFCFNVETNCVCNFHLFQRRLAKEARIQEMQAKNAALGKKVKESTATKAFKGRGEASYYKVTCKVWFIYIALLLLFSYTRCFVRLCVFVQKISGMLLYLRLF